MQRNLAAAVAVLLAAALAAPAGAATGKASTRPRVSVGPRLIEVTAPDIQALAARPGARATLVNLWATWCVPCRKEFPALLGVARAHAADSLRLVLVSTDFPDQWAAARKFLKSHGISGASYIKTGGDMPFINTLEPRWSGALPATLVYDRAGRLVEFWEGESDSARFERAVAQALNPKPKLEDSPR